MNRIAKGYREAIQAGIDRIPFRVEADFLTGVDPVFAGLHRSLYTGDGRAYSGTAHCVYPLHQLHLPRAGRRTTVVLPRETEAEPWIVVHELGHVLHHDLGLELTAKPVTRYAETNNWEAFAEAFTAWLCPEYPDWTRERLAKDPATVALFEELKHSALART